MARAGRPRKPGARYPSGKLRPSVVAQLVEHEKRKDAEMKATVLAQPHRRGETSQWAECALGRYCLRHKLRDELFNAGERWAVSKRKWLSVWGAPLPDKAGYGSGGDVPSDIAQKWREDFADGYSAMVSAAGETGAATVDRLAFDGIDAPSPDGVPALFALATFMGFLSTQGKRG